MNTPASRHRLLSAVAAGFGLLVVVLLAHQAVASAAAPNRPALVATVDLERLFEGLNERSRADAALQAMAEQLDTSGKAQREAIEALRGELEIYPVGGDKYNEAMEKLSLKVLEFEAFMEFGRRKLDVEKAHSIKRIYLNIKDAVKAAAQAGGIDIVLVDDSIVELPSGSETDVKRSISARRVLFANPAIDITDDLMARMNTP